MTKHHNITFELHLNVQV